MLITEKALEAHIGSLGVAVPSALVPVAQVAIVEAQHRNWTGILDFPAGYTRTVEQTVDKLRLHDFVTENSAD